MLRWVRLGLILLGVTLYAPTSALAALSYYANTTDEGLSYVVVSGEFLSSDDLTDFSRTIARSGATVVAFDSPGGSVAKAIELGRLIRAMGLWTFQPRDFECVSACALAFMGGAERLAQPGAIGVHRSTFGDASLSSDDAVEAIQQGTAFVVAYMVEMGVDAALLELMLGYSSRDVRYLSLSEMQHYRVVSIGDSLTPQVATPSPRTEDAASDQAEKATEFVASVIGAHTQGQRSALQSIMAAYAGRVRYYGKTQPLSDVLKDKRAYFDRWPERFYSVRPGSVTTRCDASLCEISGVYDWSVRSVPRNKQASGSATFRYVVQIGQALQIVEETSEVLSRR